MNSKSTIKFCTIIAAGLFMMLAGSCDEKKTAPVPAPETGTVTDVDGTVYRTVKIGTQWWMAENLKVKKYRNGVPVSQAQVDTAVWNNDKKGAYCQYDNNTAAPGFLYNGYAVTSKNNIAPQGWHIPTDEEWKVLEKYLGMNQADADKSGWRGTHEGEKLKIEATQGWIRYADVWGTNETGFSALAGSCRLFNGAWGQPGLFSTGFWWSATENSANEAWYRYLDYKNANIFRSHISKNYGFSIRCVKD